MSRPAVSVVMPFAGDAGAARAAAESLSAIDAVPGDELILADNGGIVGELAGVTVVPAPGERSPAHARNVGAAAATRDWILFIDADCRPSAGLLDAYFAGPIGAQVGALAGEVVGAEEADTLVARYGTARGFLGQRAHLAHPYRPRAAAANLLVRRAAFVQIGGFFEGVRAAEDTDFSWRLQQAGWQLELAEQAVVEHRYRTTLSDLRRQWRGYAAGRAWLARRYTGFEPRPAALRALSRGRRRAAGDQTALRTPPRVGAWERGRYLALDALLGAEELAGFALSNRPREPGVLAAAPVDVVLLAGRFPAQGDPLVELAGAIENVRIEALARPELPDMEIARSLAVDYIEDDGAATRAAAATWLIVRHPLRSVRDRLTRGSRGPTLRELAPAVARLNRDPGARVQPLGGEWTRATAQRLARLAGRRLDS